MTNVNAPARSPKEAQADIQAAKWPIPVNSFNDDDVYVYVAANKEFIRQIPCSMQEAKDARHIGVRVKPGETWAKGMTAKYLGIWNAA